MPHVVITARMIFTSPLFLFLLLALPFFSWLGWPARGPSRARESVSLALRVLIALLLILSLAGLEVRQSSEALSVVFLVDYSDSLPPEAKQAELAYVREALTKMGPNDKSAVIVFGGEARVERSLSASKELEGFTSKVTTIQTDLAEAIRLGLALLPLDTARRMVILSDGIETTGDALEAARLAATSGAQILVVPFRVTGSSEAMLTDVHAPPRLRQGEEFGLEVKIDSTLEQTVGVRVFAGAAVVYEGTLELNKGENPFTLPLTAGTPGFSAYRVQITPQDATAGTDQFYQNNELAAFSQIEGPPKILLVQNPNPRDGIDESRELIAALRAADMNLDVVRPSELPSELTALAEYASVVLVDVPARALTPRQMTALQTYVRDLGGGLLAVGGPASYGVGGYFRTPLEEALPVEMQIKDQKRRPHLTLVFIIDKSGSMADTSGGAAKVDLAKEAAMRSIELLSPTDKVGVIAFDDSASWVVPITPLDNPDAVKNAIGSIRADGGTDIFSGVKLAAGQLPADDSAVKHIILLTDGMADPSGIPELVRSLHDNDGVTLSAVAMGRDADQTLLQQLAQIGEGSYHFAENPASVPSIFTEETTLATRAYIIEEEFFPQLVSTSPILQGIENVPALLGYIGTTAKTAAQTILISKQNDPILTAWQYGLGKSVAWTSDATGRWAKNWVSWEQYTRFWAQAVRFTLSEGAVSSAAINVTRQGEHATITLDARSDQGAYLNGLTTQANVVGPDGKTQTVTLQQVAPGRYIGEFEPTTEGAYLIRVAGADATGGEALAQTGGWVLSYSPEYQTLNADPNFLVDVAERTSGTVVGEVEEIYAHTLTAPARATRPLWPWLLALAALLWPLDIATRRLVVTRGDLLYSWRKLQGVFVPTPAAAPQRAEQLSALFKAKDRAGETIKPNSDVPPPPVNAPPPIVTRPTVSEKPAPPPVSAPTATPPSSTAGASTSAALLAKKRARKNDE